ncbi:MAG: hypothetical protein AVDCRST_MAG05-4766, partial [uncultured Rubrobacteraceae bacterium]
AAPAANRGPRRLPGGPGVAAQPAPRHEGGGPMRLPVRLPRPRARPAANRGRGALGPLPARRRGDGVHRGAAGGQPLRQGAGADGEPRAGAAGADGRGRSGRGSRQDGGALGDSLRGGAPWGGAARL